MLLNLVNDLLDLAKIEQNTFQFNEEYFDLIQTIENAFNQCRYLADSKGIRLIKKIKNKTHDQMNLETLKNILGDSRRYLQIILNFLSNSLKFTGTDGTITVVLNLIELQKVKLNRPNVEKYIRNCSALVEESISGSKSLSDC